MEKIILSAKNLTKIFHGNHKENMVLNHVNVEIYKEDFTIIMGASGAGKSTLLYALSGMDAITEGSVKLRGESEDIHKLSEKQMAVLRADRFGFVFQQTHLVSNLSIEENILVAGYNGKNRSAEEVRKRTGELMKELYIEKTRSQLPGQTSGGEAQRAAIARALINEPDILFADEPTGALNRRNTLRILDILTEINNKGQSILMVTHDIKAAVRGSRILYLSDGVVIGELRLPGFSKEDARNREEQVTKWLQELEW